MTEAEQYSVRQANLSVLIMQAQDQVYLDRINNLPFSHSENWHKLEVTFGPFHRWLDNFEATGEFEAVDDMPVIRPERGVELVYPLVESLLRVCETYELIAVDLRVADQSAPLLHLAKLIADGASIFQKDIIAARKALGWMRELTKKLTPMQYSDYAVAIQTRAELVAAGHLPVDEAAMIPQLPAAV